MEERKEFKLVTTIRGMKKFSRRKERRGTHLIDVMRKSSSKYKIRAVSIEVGEPGRFPESPDPDFLQTTSSPTFFLGEGRLIDGDLGRREWKIK